MLGLNILHDHRDYHRDHHDRHDRDRRHHPKKMYPIIHSNLSKIKSHASTLAQLFRNVILYFSLLLHTWILMTLTIDSSTGPEPPPGAP